MDKVNPLIFVRVVVQTNTGDFRVEVATLDKAKAFSEHGAEDLWFTEVHIYQGNNLRSVYVWHPYEGVWKPDIGQPNVIELDGTNKTQNLHAL